MIVLRQPGPRTFLLTAYLFSYALWILAWAVAASNPAGLLLNESFMRSLLFGDPTGPDWAPTLLALLAVYGPLAGALVAVRADRDMSLSGLWSRIVKVRVPARWYLYALAILLITWFLPFTALLVVNGGSFRSGLTGGQVIAFLVAFLVFQLLTSGLEEVGWRGYLLEKVLPNRSLWDAGWLVGIAWALWHFPIVIFLFLQQGMQGPALVGSLIGFSIGIVGMSILHAWFYSNTRSVFLAIVIHASFNTFPLTTGMLFENSYAAALASQLLLWATVLVIVNRVEKRAGAGAAVEIARK